MFGAVIRLAAAFAGSMVAASVLKEVLDPFVLPMLADTIGKDSMLYSSLNGVLIYLPMIVLITACLALVYRGVIERRLSGA